MKKAHSMKTLLFVLSIVFTLSTGPLFADVIVGTQGGPFGKGAVYKYEGGESWTKISEGADLGQAVMDIVDFNGVLFAATQTRSGYGGYGGVGQVWRYDGSAGWTKVGEMGTSCMSFMVMNSQLYVAVTNLKAWLSTTQNGQELYRYDGEPMKWTLVGATKGYSYPLSTGFSKGIVSKISGKEAIYLGELDADTFYRYTPEEGLKLMANYWRSCVFSLKEIGGKIYSGCWHGSLYSSTNGSTYSVLANGFENHFWAVEGFRDQVYIGTGSGGYTATKTGDLRVLGSSGMVKVKEWPVSRQAEGVSALASDGAMLFIGLGVPDGYYSGDGVAEVWTYDGSSFNRICSADFFGGGVQKILVTAPAVPKLALGSMTVGPATVACGGNSLVTVSSVGAYVKTDENSLLFSLPEGWSVQNIDGSANGNGRFSAAIVAPEQAPAGSYSFSVRVKGVSLRDGMPIESNSLNGSINFVKSIGESDRVCYDQGQEAILQLRAWDLNLEDPTISLRVPPLMDLSALGFRKEESRAFSGTQYNLMHTRYQVQTSSGTTTTNYYYLYGLTTSLASYNEYSYSFKSATSVYGYSYKQERFPIFDFDVQLPSSVLRISSAKLNFTSGYSLPVGGTFTFNGNEVLLDPMTAARDALTADLQDGTVLAAVAVSSGSSQSLSILGGLPTKGRYRIGFDMLQDLCSLTQTSRSYSSWSYSYSYMYKYGYLVLSGSAAPQMVVVCLLGYTPAEVTGMGIDMIRSVSFSKSIDLLKYLNGLYGKTPDQWGIRHGCEEEGDQPHIVIARSDLRIMGNALIKGSVHSDRDMAISGSVHITGHADAVGAIRINGRPEIDGGSKATEEKIFPSEAEVLQAVGAVKTIKTKKLHIKPKDAADYSGVIFVEGDVEITGNSIVNATIIATGDIKIAGTVTVKGQAGGYALYTEKGKIDVTGTSDIRGKVAGNEVKIPGTVTVSR